MHNDRVSIYTEFLFHYLLHALTLVIFHVSNVHSPSQASFTLHITLAQIASIKT